MDDDSYKNSVTTKYLKVPRNNNSEQLGREESPDIFWEGHSGPFLCVLSSSEDKNIAYCTIKTSQSLIKTSIHFTSLEPMGRLQVKNTFKNT